MKLSPEAQDLYTLTKTVADMRYALTTHEQDLVLLRAKTFKRYCDRLPTKTAAQQETDIDPAVLELEDVMARRRRDIAVKDGEIRAMYWTFRLAIARGVADFDEPTQLSEAQMKYPEKYH